MKPILPTLLSLTLLQGCIVHVHADEELNMQKQQLQLDARQLNALNAETGAGALTIVGEPGRTQIEVDATVYSRPDTKVTLSLAAQDKTAIFVAKTEDHFSIGESPRIDLVVKMPAALALTLSDGSGEIEVRGVQGPMQINDGSGDIQVSQAGALQLTDGSGEIKLANLQGNVQVSDGSGEINGSNLNGAVQIEDGSGDIRLNGIGGLVTVEDGSGDIDVNGAAGLTVTSPGSGDVSYQNIRGAVTIPSEDDNGKI